MITQSFTEKYISIRHQFPWEYKDRQTLAAFLCILDDDGIPRDSILSEGFFDEKLAQCKKILKERIRITSAFRDHLRLPLVLRMAFAKDANEYLDGVLKVYQEIKPTYFTGSGQRLLTAMVIYENTPVEQVKSTCVRTYEIYEKMKAEHPILTGQEDMAFAAMLAVGGEEVDGVIEEMEKCFALLNKKYPMKKGIMQNVSHVLALSDQESEEKTKKFFELYNQLKDEKSKAITSAHLVSLAALSILNASVEDTVKEVKETEATVRKLNNMLRRTINRQEIKLMAIVITSFRHLMGEQPPEQQVKTDLVKSILRNQMISALVIEPNYISTSSHK